MKYQIWTCYPNKEEWILSSVHTSGRVRYFIDINEALRTMEYRQKDWPKNFFEIREYNEEEKKD